MATERIGLTFLCLVTCSLGQWQRGLNPPSENGFNDLLEAVHPVTIYSRRKENVVQVIAKYQPNVLTVPFWKIDIEGESDQVRVLGRSQSEGDAVVSMIELNQEAVVRELYFHLSSRIGEVVLEINFENLKDLDGEVEIPAVGVKPLVPPVYRPMPVESACIGQYIYVKFEKENDIELEYGRDVEFTFVENDNDHLSRESKYYFHHYLERNKHFYGMEIELKSEYVRNGSEITAAYTKYKSSGENTNRYIESVSKKVNSLIQPTDPVQYIRFHDELGMFLNFKQTIEISNQLENRSIDCAAFGHPKPVVEILDANGNSISSTEVTLGHGMTTHVIASIENIPVDKIHGEYKCVASNDVENIEQTVTVKASPVK